MRYVLSINMRLRLLAVFLLGLSACSGPDVSFRCRITIAINTPHGIKSSSGVVELNIYDDSKKSWYPPDARLVRWRTRGEAIIVDLGDGQQVVALLKVRPEGYGWLEFNELVTRSYSFTSISELSQLLSTGEAHQIAITELPVFVAFRDLSIPASASIVKPEHFDRVFGRGFSLSSATIEITSDPITKVLHRSMPWLDDDESLRRFARALHGREFGPKSSVPKSLLVMEDRR